MVYCVLKTDFNKSYKEFRPALTKLNWSNFHFNKNKFMYTTFWHFFTNYWGDKFSVMHLKVSTCSHQPTQVLVPLLPLLFFLFVQFIILIHFLLKLARNGELITVFKNQLIFCVCEIKMTSFLLLLLIQYSRAFRRSD